MVDKRKPVKKKVVKKKKAGPTKPKVKTVKQAAMETVLRSEIHTPDYNPRYIDTGASDKLRKQIKEDGLVDTLVVNKQTMNVVGGNQRTAQLDKIYRYEPGKSDYQINVQMIDVDPRTEVKINTRLNNPDASGDYDAAKLLDIMTEFEIDPLVDMNFDRATFDFFVTESGLESPFAEIETHIQEVRDVTNQKGSIEQAQVESEQPSLQEQKKAHIEKQEEDNRSGASEYFEADDYILTIVFNNNQEKHDFMLKINKPKSEKFIKGSILRDLVKPEYL